MASTLAAQAKAPEWDGVSKLTIVPQAKTDVQWYRCRDQTGFCLRGVQA